MMIDNTNNVVFHNLVYLSIKLNTPICENLNNSTYFIIKAVTHLELFVKTQEKSHEGNIGYYIFTLRQRSITKLHRWANLRAYLLPKLYLDTWNWDSYRRVANPCSRVTFFQIIIAENPSPSISDNYVSNLKCQWIYINKINPDLSKVWPKYNAKLYYAWKSLKSPAVSVEFHWFDVILF